MPNIIKTIKLDVREFTSYEDIKRVNDELGEKAKKGLLVPLRQEPDLLELAEPRINGIWRMYLNKDGNIKKIILF